MSAAHEHRRERPTAVMRPAAAAGLAIVALAAVVILAPRGVRTPPPGSAPPSEVRLRDLLSRGPGPGLWSRRTLRGTSEWAVTEHPEDPDCLVVARVDEEGRAGRPRRWTRRQAADRFAPGTADLFFRNYRCLSSVVAEGNLVHETWVPRFDHGGESARHLWSVRETGEVVRLEDRSYLGFCVRFLDRLGPAPALDAQAARGSRPCADATACRPAPASPARVASRAPFVLLAPRYLPPGFELVEAGYHERRLRPWPSEVPGTATRTRVVRLAFLTYSDGLATIALGIAPSDEMDSFEVAKARLPSNPEACPPLPAPQHPVEQEGRLIRRRHDRCRTVLRFDTEFGVSVSLLGLNELPLDEYIQTLASVDPVEPEPQAPGSADPDPRDEGGDGGG